MEKKTEKKKKKIKNKKRNVHQRKTGNNHQSSKTPTDKGSSRSAAGSV